MISAYSQLDERREKRKERRKVREEKRKKREKREERRKMKGCHVTAQCSSSKKMTSFTWLISITRAFSRLFSNSFSFSISVT